MIFLHKIKSRYDYAEEMCEMALQHRQNEQFYAPIQTLLLLRIDKASEKKTRDIIKWHLDEYRLPLKILRSTINNIKHRRKYNEAEAYVSGIGR